MRVVRALVLVAAGLGSGCGETATRGTGAGSSAPLTVAEWKALPVDQKYTAATLERLKKGDPNLETAEGWVAFQKTVVGPARKKDFPSGKTR